MIGDIWLDSSLQTSHRIFFLWKGDSCSVLIKTWSERCTPADSARAWLQEVHALSRQTRPHFSITTTQPACSVTRKYLRKDRKCGSPTLLSEVSVPKRKKERRSWPMGIILVSRLNGLSRVCQIQFRHLHPCHTHQVKDLLDIKSTVFQIKPLLYKTWVTQRLQPGDWYRGPVKQREREQETAR